MSDDTLNNEVVVEQPIIEQPEQEEVQAIQPEPATPQPPKREESENKENIRLLRKRAEQAERIERERDDALRRLKEFEAQKEMASQAPEDDELTIGPDDLAEGKHLSKVTKKIKKLEEQLLAQQQQSATMSTEALLKAKYADFDAVVSKENIEALRENYPEIAETIGASQNIYSKAVSAYTMIKKLGIHVEDLYTADKAIAQKNAAKPKPLASVSPQQGDSPLSRANAFANGLTEELKVQLRKEMEDARRAY